MGEGEPRQLKALGSGQRSLGFNSDVPAWQGSYASPRALTLAVSIFTIFSRTTCSL